MVDVVLGLQWGDEGKGKIVDFLAPNYDIVARFQGGPNAGHTLIFENHKVVLHTIPSGIFRKGIFNFIGSGVVVDPITLKREIKMVKSIMPDAISRLLISNGAHLILPTHRMLDAASEAAKGKKKIGSTLKGIGPTYMDKTGRNGLRVGDISLENFKERYSALRDKHLNLLKLYPKVSFDLEAEEQKWFEAIEEIKKIEVVEGTYYINDALEQGRKVLAEGAQGTMLDIDFGTYPYVTSSNTVTAGCCIGLGISPHQVGEVIGIFKAYVTRVGGGSFPTELFDEQGRFLQEEGHEFGATTGRPRRCGWLDLVQLRYSILINGVTRLALTKIDIFDKLEQITYADKYLIEGQESRHFPFDLDAVDVEPQYEHLVGWQQSLAGSQSYDALPEKAKEYISLIEQKVKVPVQLVSTGAERESLVVR
ncbi:MAG TPA: adenylosuccinate synthase [Saprospiraceae bacterium]|nr:adenylosuccinate synthase [Saprospiraceae bacterium]